MELWIRSQNGCKLRKTELINYSYENGKHIVDCNGYPCGTYESKKRCLEIIDEIQRKLSVSTTLEFDKGNNIKYRQNNVIYNMPKE